MTQQKIFSFPSISHSFTFSKPAVQPFTSSTPAPPPLLRLSCTQSRGSLLAPDAREVGTVRSPGALIQAVDGAPTSSHPTLAGQSRSCAVWAPCLSPVWNRHLGLLAAEDGRLRTGGWGRGSLRGHQGMGLRPGRGQASWPCGTSTRDTRVLG